MISEVPIPDSHPKTPNASLEQIRRDELHAARSHLLNVFMATPSFQKEWKDVNNVIAEVEALLGVK